MAGQAPALDHRIARIAADRESGASELLDRAIGIVADARKAGTPIEPVVSGLCRAQPAMASFWTLATESLASDQRFEQFVQRVRRAPQAMARFAVECVANDGGGGPLRLVTLSRSRSVLTVFDALHRRRDIRVWCAESRPGLEGRALASQLASIGVAVTVLSDAAIAHAMDGADAVVVGADAVGPAWFLNKSGTRMLAAAAAQQGVPVYVAATRDKFVGAAIGERLVLREGAPGEIWDAAPAGVEVRNPCFEATPLEMVTSVISDIGVLGTGMIPDVCEAAADAAAVRTLLEAMRELLGSWVAGSASRLRQLRQPSNPATQQPNSPTPNSPSYPATQLPSYPATRQPSSPVTIAHWLSSRFSQPVSRTS